jgi:hypothetical protein
MLGGMAMSAIAFPAAATAGLWDAAPEIAPVLKAKVMRALAAHESRIWSRDVVAIVDFGLPSAVPRLFLVDLLAGRTQAMLVAHGSGSDPEHSGRLQHFSDIVGSEATAEGAYLTGAPYVGIHGPSRRLIGMDATNAHAEERAIVIHPAWYVGPEIIARQGRLGRSNGCFAVSPTDIGPLLARLERGRLLYAGRSGG